jgi:hypothetical protein
LPAPLGSTSFNHGLTGTGAHADEKAMGAFTLDIAGLEGSLAHVRVSFIVGLFSRKAFRPRSASRFRMLPVTAISFGNRKTGNPKAAHGRRYAFHLLYENCVF